MRSLVAPDRGVRRLPRVYEYLCLYVGLLSLAALCLSWLPFALVLQHVLPEGIRGRLGRAVITSVFRFYIWLLEAMGACRFELTELDRLRDAGPLILAPNHPCLLDAVMIISRLPNVVCVMKADLMRNIFLGAGARLAAYIPNGQPRLMVKAACASLTDGAQLLLFPEGTRTARGPISPILPTTGTVARRAQAPVQTLIVETDSAFLTKGWPLFRCPAMPMHYRVRLGKRFEAPGDGRRLKADLEDYFRATLASLETPAALAKDR